MVHVLLRGNHQELSRAKKENENSEIEIESLELIRKQQKDPELSGISIEILRTEPRNSKMFSFTEITVLS